MGGRLRGLWQLRWNLPGEEDDGEEDEEERVESEEIIIEEDCSLAPDLSPGPGDQPRHQPVQAGRDDEETDQEVPDCQAGDGDVRNLESSPREEPVAGQVDCVEEDASHHGDGEEGEISPPGVVERLCRGEEGPQIATIL